MTKYSDKFKGKRRSGPHGEKPSREGVGFSVETEEIPGQEDSEDPVVWYMIRDRYDEKTVGLGVEVASKLRAHTKRQIELIAQAGGVGDALGVVITDTAPPGEN